MSFGAIETSRDRGEPITLMLFRYGDGANDYYAYTDAEVDFPFEGVTYKPQAISMDEIESSGTLDNATMNIAIDQGAELVDLFRLRPPSSVVTLIARQGHANDPDDDFIVGWAGRVTSFEINGDDNTATFGCEPISTSMQRSMLRRHWQYACPHYLYGPQCRAVRATHSTNQVVLAVNGPTLTLSSTWVSDALKMKHQGGACEWINSDGRRELRRVVQCSADGTVLLATAPDDLDAGDSVKMVLACNHKTGIASLGDDGDCGPLFNNIRNFGGMPWIPLKNPVGFKNNFY